MSEKRETYHVNASVDPRNNGVGVIGAPSGCDSVDSFPVGDEESLETQLILEDVSEEEAVGMHFRAIPGWVRDHDSGHALCNGGRVAFHVDVDEAIVIDHCVAFVSSVNGAAIAHKMLRTSCYVTAAMNNKAMEKPSSETSLWRRRRIIRGTSHI